MHLNTTSDIIRIRTDAAAASTEPIVFATWRAVEIGATTSYLGDLARKRTVCNGTTNATIVTSPGSGEAFQVNSIIVLNRDSATRDFTIEFFDGTDAFVLFEFELAAGHRWEWNFTNGMGIRYNTLGQPIDMLPSV